RPSLQAGKKTKRGSPEAGPGRDQGIFYPLRRRRPRPLPRPRILRNLHALPSPRNGTTSRLRSPPRIPPPHRRSRIRYHPSPHPRSHRGPNEEGTDKGSTIKGGANKEPTNGKRTSAK